MKTIVVPTDFSENANNALQYAIHIANQFESKIHLIHIYEVKSTTGALISVRDFMKNDAEEQLSAIVKANKKRLFRSTSMKAKAMQGYSITGIVRYAASMGADAIIMGTQGASGLKEIFMGSNTVGVINKSKTPVLAIPSNAKFKGIDKITFAVDSLIVTSEDVVRPLVRLTKEYDAKVEVIHVEKQKQMAVVDAGIDVYLGETDHSFHLIQDEDVIDGINKHVDQSKANLLCMVHRKRGILSNLFHTSITNKEAYNSPVPLLVLNDIL